MQKEIQGLYVGERALYHRNNLELIDATFQDGESPLKECHNIILRNSIFKWKYPMWYSSNIEVYQTCLLDTARSGIWYTDHIKMENCTIEAPKTFRRSLNIVLKNVSLVNAEETLWSCKDIELNKVVARGNYFGMNCENVSISDFTLVGNYAFDGGKNITISNAKMNSKDSFWNCENVIVKDSFIIGEYLGWNSKNITFINCTIDSNQGICYMENIKMVNCKLINTDLCFELCKNIDAEIISKIDSVKNPISGSIKAKKIDQIILNEELIDPNNTTIVQEGDDDEI
jgi:hypothetical protein